MEPAVRIRRYGKDMEQPEVRDMDQAVGEDMKQPGKWGVWIIVRWDSSSGCGSGFG
jgi:hypothetical protein